VTGLTRAPLRGAAGWAGALLLPLGLWLAALQQPRFTWLNSGVRIEYPPAAALWALLAAAGASAAAVALGRRARPWLALVAAAALLYALQLNRYRVAIESAGIAERGVLGSRMLAWKDVGRVESGTRRVVVWGRDEQQVRIDAAAFAGEDRARLDRTLSRRIRESASSRP
jgi:hypothetical protein